MTTAVLGLVVLLCHLGEPQIPDPSSLEGSGNKPPSPVWSLVEAGADADLLRQPATSLVKLPPPGLYASSQGTAVARSSPPHASVIAEFRQIVLDLANAERRAHGCKPLMPDSRLQRSAQSHADDMATRNYHDHPTPEGAKPGARMLAAGYHWTAWGGAPISLNKGNGAALDRTARQHGGVADLLWDDVRCFFDADLMGSLPDVRVPDCSVEDWQAVLDLVEVRGWKFQHSEGETVLPVPRAETVLSRPADAECPDLRV